MSFKSGFAKTAFIGPLVGGAAKLAGKGAMGLGKAVVKSQGGGVGGLVNTALTVGGVTSDMGDQMKRMRAAQMR